MFFEIIAPVYDWFMSLANVDHSRKISHWLHPVKGLDILDLAGGTGLNARALADSGARVTLVDASPAMLARARAKNLPARLIQADAAALPLPDQSFDLVLVSDAWHHLRNQHGVIKEITRLLRPGGRLVIIDFDSQKMKTRLLALLEKMVAEPSTFTTPDKLSDTLSRAGFEGSYRYITANQFIYQGVLTNQKL